MVHVPKSTLRENFKADLFTSIRQKYYNNAIQ